MMASRAVASLAWFNAKKTGSSSQGMTVRTRGIFRISTTVGLRGFFSPGLYQTGTEIWWAIKEHFQHGVCPKACVIRMNQTTGSIFCQKIFFFEDESSSAASRFTCTGRTGRIVLMRLEGSPRHRSCTRLGRDGYLRCASMGGLRNFCAMCRRIRA